LKRGGPKGRSRGSKRQKIGRGERGKKKRGEKKEIVKEEEGAPAARRGVSPMRKRP